MAEWSENATAKLAEHKRAPRIHWHELLFAAVTACRTERAVFNSVLNGHALHAVAPIVSA